MALARDIAGRAVRLPDAVRAALADLARLTGGSAGVIALDAHDLVGIQLSSTMPIAWITDAEVGDSMGEQV